MAQARVGYQADYPEQSKSCQEVMSRIGGILGIYSSVIVFFFFAAVMACWQVRPCPQFYIDDAMASGIAGMHGPGNCSLCGQTELLKIKPFIQSMQYISILTRSFDTYFCCYCGMGIAACWLCVSIICLGNGHRDCYNMYNTLILYPLWGSKFGIVAVCAIIIVFHLVVIAL